MIDKCQFELHRPHWVRDRNRWFLEHICLDLFMTPYQIDVRQGFQSISRLDIPVSEKKVLNPWSWACALRSSVKYPSGCTERRVRRRKISRVIASWVYLNAVLQTVQLKMTWSASDLGTE